MQCRRQRKHYFKIQLVVLYFYGDYSRNLQEAIQLPMDCVIVKKKKEIDVM